MENEIQVLTEKLCDIVGEYEKMGEEIPKTVEGYSAEAIQQAFCELTGGEFVTHDLFPNCRILNKFPNIVIKDMKRKGIIIEYPFIKKNRYYIRIDQDRPCHKVAYIIGTNCKEININGINFKDGNELNYQFSNLVKGKIKEEKKKKTVKVECDEEGNEIVVEEITPSTQISKREVCEAKIDIRNRDTITTIRNKAPYRLETKKDWIAVIKDLRSVFAFIDCTPEIYIFKDTVFDPSIKKSMMKIVTTNDATARSKLEKLFIGKCEGKDITGWSVFRRYTQLFAFSYLTFYEEEDEDVFSLFRGFYWDEVDVVEEKVIQKFLDFVLEVISNNDKAVNEYILNWIAKLLQNPGIKLESMIVLTGKQGCGKSTFTNIIATLCRGYSKPNVTSIEHISGKFNASILGMILIIGNEWTSASVNKYIDKGRHKGVITEDTIEIERKGKDAFTAQNCANFIVNSNEQDPVIIEANDRRHLATEISEKYMQNEEYFGQLKNLPNNFYEHLFSYFRKRPLGKWSERKIPMTASKETIMKKHEDVYRAFIRDMRETIERTSKVTDRETGENPTYNLFEHYAKSHGFGIPKSTTFEAEMKKYCNTKQHSVGGIRMTTYIIEESRCKDWIQREKPNIIEPKTVHELMFEREKGVDEIMDDF